MSKKTEKRFEWKRIGRTVLAVAKEGYAKDWAAYIGGIQAEQSSQEAAPEVAAHGCKMPRKMAELLFPDWKDLEWRE